MKTSEKLNHLADWLDKNITKRQFNFNAWGNKDGCLLTKRKDPYKCNTTCCAAGWAEHAFPELKGQLWVIHDGVLGFRAEILDQFLELDKWHKRRRGDKWPTTDFERLFGDDDDALRDQYGGWLSEVPLKAVTARIRACAQSYQKRGR